jgi:tight adherence protein B
MNSSVGADIALSVVVGGLIGMIVIVLIGGGRTTNVAKRVSAYVTPTPEMLSLDPRRSLVERALGDKQARQLARSPRIARIRTEMEVADIKLGLEQFFLIVLVVTVLVGWAVATSTHSLPAALLGLFVPVLAQQIVRFLAARQRRTFSEQLPDNLAVLASAMRAGQTFIGALRSVLEDAPEPSRRELSRAVLDEQIGASLSDALTRVTERMRSEDFQHVVIVASLQRETGGNTAEVIDMVAHTVRERMEIRRMVRGLTAQGRLSGGVLSLLPIGLLILISVVNPTYVHPLFHTTPGLIGLGVGIGLVACGGLAIRKIVDIKV